MTSAGGRTYGYNSRNDLFTTGTGGNWYRGPVGLLSQEPGVGNLDWIGSHLVTESNSSVDRRYVYAPGEDTPLVWYEGAGTSDKRWLHTDERGSVVAVSDGSGAAMAINRYDEYGQPAASNLGRFGYTGQQWIAGLGLWDYKARMYSPSLGRFMQTDRIGFGDGLNWYGYVGGDPVNRVDPLGLAVVERNPNVKPIDPAPLIPDVIVRGVRLPDPIPTPILTFGIQPAPAGLLGIAERNDGAGASPQNICSAPLSGAANRGQTVNSRRAQVRREIRQAINLASRTGGDVGAAYNGQVGINISRLTPNVGTWIRGGTSRSDGNFLYGAITAELGIPLSVAFGVGDAAEFADDIIDRIGLGSAPDEGIGGDSPEARRQIEAGARCPG